VPDLLIRGVPDEVAATLDAQARRLGISRTEHLRRQMVRLASTGDAAVTVDALRRFSETFVDLGDPDVMRRAWE